MSMMNVTRHATSVRRQQTKNRLMRTADPSFINAVRNRVRISMAADRALRAPNRELNQARPPVNHLDLITEPQTVRGGGGAHLMVDLPCAIHSPAETVGQREQQQSHSGDQDHWGDCNLQYRNQFC